MWVIEDERRALNLAFVHRIEVSGDGDDLTVTAIFKGDAKRNLRSGMTADEVASFFTALARGENADLRSYEGGIEVVEP